VNVSTVWMNHHGSVAGHDFIDTVGIRKGRISCFGTRDEDGCADFDSPIVIDLEGGDLTTGLVASSAALGLAEIAMESSTTDGVVMDSLLSDVPEIIGGEKALVRAVDGLQFGTRNALLVNFFSFNPSVLMNGCVVWHTAPVLLRAFRRQ
jgi:hypothetical protein